MNRPFHEVDFFYDPISPYAYLAFEGLPKALMGKSVMLRYRPVLFGALLKANGALGPAEIPGKREWTFRQVMWLAHRQQTPLDMPTAHPFNPLDLLRLGLSTATDDAPSETNRYVTEQLFHHVWRGGQDPLEPKRLFNLHAKLQDHMRQRSKPWVDPQSEQVKQRLRTNTDEALALGVFGVPSMVVSRRVFWGLDALPMLSDFLDGEAWFQGGGWEAAAQLPVGIHRKG